MATKKELYRDLRAQLDLVVEQMQSPDIDIEESLELYKKGQSLIHKLNKYLETAKIEIENIKTLG